MRHVWRTGVGSVVLVETTQDALPKKSPPMPVTFLRRRSSVCTTAAGVDGEHVVGGPGDAAPREEMCRSVRSAVHTTATSASLVEMNIDGFEARGERRALMSASVAPSMCTVRCSTRVRKCVHTRLSNRDATAR